jgi:hypothetical protein
LDLQTNGTTAISISASQVVTFANQPAYTGGTANGVLYLNGSKVLTSGSALTFDGSQLDIPLGSAATPSLSTPTDPNTGMFFPAADTIAFAEGGVEAMRLDASGNMGLGVTPAAWFTGGGYKVMQIGPGMAFDSGNDFRARITANGFVNSSGDFRYLNTGAASNYNQAGGEHKWFTAPSGTAGNAITFTQAMVLDSTGQLQMYNSSGTAMNALKGSNFGYSTSYKALILGSTSGTFTPCINVDPSGNASGAFSGSGGEVMFRNGASLITPNSANTAFFPVLTFDANGYGFKARTNIGVGDATPASSGGGITFPATQLPSSDANTLDDYEEGTWTPSIGSTSGVSGVSAGTHWYRKVGSLVVVTGVFSYTSATAGAAYIVCNLPFSMSASSDPICGVCNSYPYDNNRQSGIVLDNSSGNPNDVYIGFYVSSTNAGNVLWSLSYRST